MLVRKQSAWTNPLQLSLKKVSKPKKVPNPKKHPHVRGKQRRRKVKAEEMGLHPIRTCLGCNARLPKSELIRHVWRDGAAVADPDQLMPGRGAYHCDNEQCRERFKKNRKRLERAFRLT